MRLSDTLEIKKIVTIVNRVEIINHPGLFRKVSKKRLENDILGTSAGQDALDAMITRSTESFLSEKTRDA